MDGVVKIAPRLVALLALAGACERAPVGDGKAEHELERERAPVARENVSTAASLAFQEALNVIAETRCDHEQRCNNVGDGRRYGTPHACSASVRGSLSEDIVPAHCPNGVDRRGLSACVKQVREERCGEPLDTLGHLASCRVAALCPRS